MAIKKLNPYLNFNGTAAKAIKLYEKALDAKTENVMPWPSPEGQPPRPRRRTASCTPSCTSATASSWSATRSPAAGDRREQHARRAALR